MSTGLSSIGLIKGFVTKMYSTGNGTYITIFTDRMGELRAVLVDDGLEVKEYGYAKPSSKIRKSKLSGILSRGSES